MFEQCFEFIVNMLNAFWDSLNTIQLSVGSWSFGVGYLFIAAIVTLMFAGIFFKNARG